MLVPKMICLVPSAVSPRLAINGWPPTSVPWPFRVMGNPGLLGGRFWAASPAPQPASSKALTVPRVRVRALRSIAGKTRILRIITN